MYKRQDPNSGAVLMEPDRMMTEEDAKRIVDAGIESVKIRSLITCKSVSYTQLDVYKRQVLRRGHQAGDH